MKYFFCILFVAKIAFFPINASAALELDYAAGMKAGIQDLNFSLSNVAEGATLRTADGNFLELTETGTIDLEIDQTIYVLDIWGSVAFRNLRVTSFLQVSPPTNTGIQIDTERFEAEDGPRESELETIDYNLTVGFDVWEGLNLFGGYKFTQLDLKARETSFILGSKDSRYQEQGFFMGGSYTWRFNNKLSMSLSAAYALLDIEFSDTDLNAEKDVANLVTFGEFKFSGVGRGLSVGVQWSLPVTEHWVFGSGVKFQSYDSDTQTTTLAVMPIVVPQGATVDPILVDEIETEHTDVTVSIGFQYLF